MKKKGMSHIEAILAFIIFISSIIAMLYFFNFPKDKSSTDSNLDEAYYKIIDNVSTEYSVYGITVNSQKDININLSSNITGKKVYAEDYLKKKVNATIKDYDNGLICLVSSDGASSINKFIYVYLSDEITENHANVPGTCIDINENNYSVGNNYNENFLSINNLLILNNTYYSNYTLLKSKLGILGNQDFAFSVERDNTPIIVAERSIPQGIQIFAKDYKIKLVNESTQEIIIANLRIKIW